MKFNEMMKIGDIADVYSGFAFKSKDLSDDNSGIRVIKIGNLNGSEVDYSNTQFFPKKLITKKIEKFALEDRDILIAMTGQGSVGRVSQLRKKKKDDYLLLNQRVGKFIVDSEKGDRDFLFFVLSSKRYQDILFAAGSGSGQPNLSPSIIKDIQIPKLDIDIQRKIGQFLSLLNDKIENNNKINNNLYDLLKSEFRSKYCSVDGEKVVLGELIENTIGGDWGKETPQGNNNTKVYCVRGADIPNMEYGNKGNAPERYILEKNYIKKKLEANNIIVEISGGSPSQSTGRTAYITENILNMYDSPLLCTNFCKAMKIKDEKKAPFVYMIFKLQYEDGIFFNWENGTTGIKNFALNDMMNNTEVVLPIDDDIENYYELFNALMNKIAANSKQNQLLEQLRDTLLPKLMNGEIDLDSIEV